jgi:N-acetylglucosaminyldiphosphoundecaprenol N-acetyl-beta-D-mannosaminyltransferase
VALVIDRGRHSVAGIFVDAVDYEGAVARIVSAAADSRPFAVSALAVHGVMTGVDDDEHRFRLNHLDMVTPDGQPVRWALNLLHGTRLKERVYGPELTSKLCASAAEHNLPVFFYGSRQEALARLVTNMVARYPSLKIAGVEPSKFRATSNDEKLAIAARIRESGAAITFVGLGCPRQEVFAYEFRDLLKMPVIAVGAAFDYHAGLLNEPPDWIQRYGLQWAFRLSQEPGRLWRRYLLLNPRFAARIAAQRLGVLRWPRPERAPLGPTNLA